MNLNQINFFKPFKKIYWFYAIIILFQLRNLIMRYFSEQELLNLSVLFERDPQYTLYGIYFGFPNCCIESFIHHPGVQAWYKEGPHTGTGYIPCMHCMEKANTQWQEQEHIISARRIAHQPFPEDRFNLRNWDVEVFFIEFCNMLGYDAEVEAKKMHNETRILKVLSDATRYQATFKRIRSKFTAWHPRDRFSQLLKTGRD